MARRDVVMTVRVTEELRCKLAQAAEASDRSINREMFKRLEQSMDGAVDIETVLSLVDRNGKVARSALTSIEKLSNRLDAMNRRISSVEKKIDSKL